LAHALLHSHHLLHHLGVHTTSAAHHGVATSAHASSQLLLHHLEVLLHALPVLSHHSRTHVVTSHTSGTALLHATLLARIETTLLTTETLFLEATAVVVIVVAAVVFVAAQVASGLSLLDFDVLAQDLKRAFESTVDCGLAVEGDETETARTASVLIHHQSGIQNATKLHEEVLEVGLSSFL
jgi:hypothetical protein